MAKRTMPVRLKRLNLEGDYEGWWVDIRLNPPMGQFLEYVVQFQNGDQEKVEEMVPPLLGMLECVVYKWNFVDDKGKDLPTNSDGYKKIGVDLLFMLAEKITDEIVEVPKAPKSS